MNCRRTGVVRDELKNDVVGVKELVNEIQPETVWDSYFA